MNTDSSQFGAFKPNSNKRWSVKNALIICSLVVWESQVQLMKHNSYPTLPKDLVQIILLIKHIKIQTSSCNNRLGFSLSSHSLYSAYRHVI